MTPSPVERPQVVEIVGQGDAGASQPQAEAPDLRHAALDAVTLSRQVYLRVDEAAHYFRFPSAKAFRAWAERQGLRAHKAGRISLYRRELLERWIEEGPQPAHTRQALRRGRRNATQFGVGVLR